jgi:hypothetical protein
MHNLDTVAPGAPGAPGASSPSQTPLTGGVAPISASTPVADFLAQHGVTAPDNLDSNLFIHDPQAFANHPLVSGLLERGLEGAAFIRPGSTPSEAINNIAQGMLQIQQARNAHAQAQAMQPFQQVAALQALQQGDAKTQQEQALAAQENAKAQALTNPNKPAHVVFSPVSGQPLAVIDPKGNEFTIGDPNMPDQYKTLAQSAQTGYQAHLEQVNPHIAQDDANARNAQWNPYWQAHNLPLNQFKAGMLRSSADDLEKTINSAAGVQQKGVQLTINQNKADTAADNSDNKALNGQQGKLDTYYRKELQAANTQGSNAQLALQELGNGAVGDALGTIKSLSSLAGGSGVRITQAELNSIAHARGVQGDFDSFLGKLTGQATLGNDQRQQLQGILQDVMNKVKLKQSMTNDGLDAIHNASDKDTLNTIDSQLRRGTYYNPQNTYKVRVKQGNKYTTGSIGGAEVSDFLKSGMGDVIGVQ